ncbi:helix-turn-helix domain-containing protein [Candidatus Clostridium stratigraminis]|uniref:Helix-turn-helix domain-containing protein n=1 Tax=Candidatus Clostridium stratigraminis TaxID=3381661 RepID=A0ABW8T1D2_9CLOT
MLFLINLKHWRIKKNLTQFQLAIRLETSPGYIYEIESNKKTPSIRMIYKIAEVLEICPKELLKCDCIKCYKIEP